MSHLQKNASRFSIWFVCFFRNRFYIALAVVFTILAFADLTYINFTSDMRQAMFDLMVRHRVMAPNPDPDIVIVDINEASLAAMAQEYGRWPWPRQVLGEFLEHLQEQHPKAVVFDMLFSDPDLYNPESDSYFDAAVHQSTNTFFPFLRLDESTDSQSQVTPAMIPGISPLSAGASPDATIGVVLPHFNSILRGGRLGFNNIYPDPDGVAREYTVYRNDHGWKVPSLPLRVAQILGYPQPSVPGVLLNWRGPPFSYRSMSFSNVYNDMLNKDKKRPQNEFTDKIVVIGSTAPSLFDVKPTPMSNLHPGVEILATAIDNLKHNDYLLFPDRRILYLSLTLFIIWATATAFYLNAGKERIDSFFGASQFLLLGISFATLNFTRIYIDLTGPVTMGLASFTIARIYGAVSERVLETNALRRSEAESGALSALLLLINTGGGNHPTDEKSMNKIRERLLRIGSVPKSVEMLKGKQAGIWALFGDTLAVAWVIADGDAETLDRARKDSDMMIAALPEILPRVDDQQDAVARWFLHEGPITGGSGAKASWRALFAEAQLRWPRPSGSENGDSSS